MHASEPSWRPIVDGSSRLHPPQHTHARSPVQVGLERSVEQASLVPVVDQRLDGLRVNARVQVGACKKRNRNKTRALSRSATATDGAHSAHNPRPLRTWNRHSEGGSSGKCARTSGSSQRSCEAGRAATQTTMPQVAPLLTRQGVDDGTHGRLAGGAAHAVCASVARSSSQVRQWQVCRTARAAAGWCRSHCLQPWAVGVGQQSFTAPCLQSSPHHGVHCAQRIAAFHAPMAQSMMSAPAAAAASCVATPVPGRRHDWGNRKRFGRCNASGHRLQGFQGAASRPGQAKATTRCWPG